MCRASKLSFCVCGSTQALASASSAGIACACARRRVSEAAIRRSSSSEGSDDHSVERIDASWARAISGARSAARARTAAVSRR